MLYTYSQNNVHTYIHIHFQTQCKTYKGSSQVSIGVSCLFICPTKCLYLTIFTYFFSSFFFHFHEIYLLHWHIYIFTHTHICIYVSAFALVDWSTNSTSQCIIHAPSNWYNLASRRGQFVGDFITTCLIVHKINLFSLPLYHLILTLNLPLHLSQHKRRFCKIFLT